MFKNISIRLRLLAGFAVVLVLSIVLAVASLYSIRSIGGEIARIIQERWPKTVQANDIIDHVNINARALRNAALLDDPEQVKKELDRIALSREAITDRVGKLEKSTLSGKGKELLEDLKAKRAAYLVNLDKAIQLIRDGKKKEVGTFLVTTMRSTQAPYFDSVTKLIQYQGEQIEEAGKEATDAVKNVQIVVLVLLVISIVLAILISSLIVRSITRPLAEGIEVANRLANGDLTASVRQGRNDEVGQLMVAMERMVAHLRQLIGKIKMTADNVASGSEQLNANAKGISRGTDGQASRSSQIATASEEMSQTVIDVAKNTSSIAQISGDTYGQAKDGETVVGRAVDEVREIASTVAASSEVMRRLGDSSKEIGNIVGVINDIADQTNLLALNAAIEAARAGEQGRGFAVVADEVRKLAERTSQATSQISSMIGTIQGEVENAITAMDTATSRVESGVELSRRAGDSLVNIVTSVDKLQAMVQQIASATEEMSSVSESISSDIQGIADGARDISSGSDQVAQASTELARLAGELKDAVGQFKV
ncbi:MAG TPA: methyl-accepting chemotaxis protein [Dissulfurispiraceae bacterium]|nr:methyl-accepting chemotaxis protein [Dissulfurispiraceae bacterium]